MFSAFNRIICNGINTNVATIIALFKYIPQSLMLPCPNAYDIRVDSAEFKPTVKDKHTIEVNIPASPAPPIISASGMWPLNTAPMDSISKYENIATVHGIAILRMSKITYL